MDIDQLKTFIAIAKTNSFSGAADTLHLTQPAISKRLAALEVHLGSALFERHRRDLKLTPAGATLLPRAETILLELERARKAVLDLATGVRGELRLATSHHLGLHKLPPVLRKFCADFPEVNLQIEFLDSEVALARVAKGQCELAVITLPPQLNGELSYQVLWQDPLEFVTHLDSPLSNATTLQALSDVPAILPDLNTYTGRLIKQCFVDRQLPLKTNMATNYLETIKMMVSVGLGWSVLPRTMLDEGLQTVPIRHIQLTRALGLVQHPKRSLSKAAQAFADMLTTNSQGDNRVAAP